MAQLVRTLGLRDLTLLAVGAVIGSGIFLVPGGILKQVENSVALAGLVWLAGGLLSLLGALTYGELAAMKPEAGGLYVYVRDGFGSLPAFLYGWSLFIAVASGTIAGLAAAFSTYLSAVIPLSPLQAKLAAIAMIAAIAVVNVRGARGSSDMQNWTTLAKVLLVVGISVVLLALGRGYSEMRASLWATGDTLSLASKFGLAMFAALWPYEGWQFITYSAGEAADPKRTFPRALVGSVAFMIAVYLLANFAYGAALGPARFSQSDTIAADSISAVLGPGAARLVSITILVSVFSATNSVLLTAPRVFYAMAEDKLFFSKLAEVHPRFHTPAVAIIALAAWSAVLTWLGKFQELVNYAMFVAWIFYGLGAASVFVYRRRHPEMERPFRVPGYPVTPLIFVGAAAVLVLNVVISTPRNAAIGLGMVLLGLPAYLAWRPRNSAVSSHRN